MLLVTGIAALPLLAQEPAKKVDAKPSNPPAPKWEIFAGYSFLSPHGTVQTPLFGETLPFSYVSVNGDAMVSIARYFDKKNLGLEIIGDVHFQNESVANRTTYVYSPKNQFSGGSGGLIYRFRNTSTTPFVHLLMGGENVDGPHWQLNHWGPVVTVGGGMDCDTSWFHHHMSIRLAQLDYQYIHENFGSGFQEGIANVNALRLSAGAVFHSATGDARAPLALACSIDHSSVFPGEPVKATATAQNSTQSVHYTWSGTGVSGSGPVATVETRTLTPGSYTVKAEVSEDHPTRECLRVLPPQVADCSASFTVKPRPLPPTVACRANPGAIFTDQIGVITVDGSSPQNSSLRYRCTASAGTLTGKDATWEFHPAGAPLGEVAIRCEATDSEGLSADASCNLTIALRPAPPPEHTRELCSVPFSRDQKRPTRVDNEAKACLDDVALSLQKDPDSRVVLVGSSSAEEKARAAKLQARKHPAMAADPAAERAVNTKDYLVTEKGIAASRIVVATSSTDGQTVQEYLLPIGATFASDVPGTTPVNETAVQPQARKPLPARRSGQ